MRIYGLDFTSAPTARKPITCARCKLERGLLSVHDVKKLPDFNAFEEFLGHDGPWVAGIDFPFGQPRKLIQNIGWPRSWESYVGLISDWDMKDFVNCLRAYRESRQIGDKQYLRETDVLARSRSPMMLYGVPVGRMFFQGAWRLLRAGVSVRPCRLTEDSRIVVEAYPALVARRWTAVSRYKHDDRGLWTEAQKDLRRRIVRGLRSGSRRAHYGASAQMSDELAEKLVDDPTGDALDGVLCALQAAWAYLQREHNYGIPGDCDPNEGWIVDPAM